MKIPTKITGVALATIMAAVSVSRAGETPAASPYLNILSATPQAELPAKAADIVAQAKNQKQATVDVVKAVVGLNPAAAPEIVGAIAQETPEMAATAASAAISLLPEQAVAIARAAAAAAPKQAGKIVEAVCRVAPKAYQEIAEAVSEVVPDAGKDILDGVALAIPSIKTEIISVLASEKSGVPSVSGVLNQVAKIDIETSVAPQAAVAVSAAQPLITVKPPYVPPPATPPTIDPGSGGQVPTGQHGYAAP